MRILAWLDKTIAVHRPKYVEAYFLLLGLSFGLQWYLMCTEWAWVSFVLAVCNCLFVVTPFFFRPCAAVYDLIDNMGGWVWTFWLVALILALGWVMQIMLNPWLADVARGPTGIGIFAIIAPVTIVVLMAHVGDD